MYVYVCDNIWFEPHEHDAVSCIYYLGGSDTHEGMFANPLNLSISLRGGK